VDKAGDLADEKTRGKYSDRSSRPSTRRPKTSPARMPSTGAAPAETPPRADVPPANPLGTTPDESTRPAVPVDAATDVERPALSATTAPAIH